MFTLWGAPLTTFVKKTGDGRFGVVALALVVVTPLSVGFYLSTHTAAATSATPLYISANFMSRSLFRRMIFPY